MGYKVRVSQFAATLDVAPGETILAAALRAALPYPHGCSSGNCAACKSELVAGTVAMARYSDIALSRAERDRGLILACRAVPLSDCDVRALEVEQTVAYPVRHLTCRVIGLADLTHDIKRVQLAAIDGGKLGFSAGQYASVGFAGLPARDYSMANCPDETPLEFHIRLVEDGAVTPYVRGRLALGDLVRVAAPFGTSYLREAHTGPILALAGGSGFAQIRAIVATALRAGKRQPITLYVGARAERDLYGEAELMALAAAHANFRFIPVLAAPEGATRRRTGLLADVLRADLAGVDLDGTKAYLAGPPVMVEGVLAALTALGLRRTDCHADAFYSAAEQPPAGAP
jgi:CDP-4-dehydro-6-deoxyglucose reductase/ferredoxin-NAD(P)+ reductase (naphthalene dioxygenase ferredoxin-specific)